MATISTPRAQSEAPLRVKSPIISHSPSSTPSSSVHPSLEIPRIEVNIVSPAPPTTSQRRNRAALRDFYNLKSRASTQPSISRTASIASTASTGITSTLTALDDASAPFTFRSQLDEADFEAETYIQELLKTSSLKTILKAEGSLISEIKHLDGERKALVYDNYSKLITATQTIGTMRKSIDEAGAGSPLNIGMLGPAIDGVAKSAAELNNGRDEHNIAQRRDERASKESEWSKRETVKWVLGTPTRLQKKLGKGQRAEAEADWEEVGGLLEQWKRVKGSAELRATCEEIMSTSIPNGDSNG